jgi:hypothetical protein
MAKAHARKKSGHFQGSRATAGQQKSAPRKRRIQQAKIRGARRSRLATANDAQARQNKVRCDIAIEGYDNWRDVFENRTVRPRAGSESHFDIWFGTHTVPILEYLRVNSDQNCVSFERSVVSWLLTRGFKLEALEVEFDNRERSTWGVCVWYKEHPLYAEAVHRMFAGLDRSLLNAMFKTDNAGDQKAGVYSMQMIGNALIGQPQILLHKTIVFRRVELSPPKRTRTSLAA